MFDIEKELQELKIKDVEPAENIVYETKMRIRNIAKKQQKQKPKKVAQTGWKTFLFSNLAVKVPVAVALLLVIACLPFLTVPVNTQPADQAYYTIDINPSVELKVDTTDIVVSVECRNSDAVSLMRNVNCIGLGISEAIKLIVAEAKNLGYITKEKENYVLVARFGPKEGGSVNQTDLAKMVTDAAGTEAKVLFLIGSLNDRQEAEGQGKPAGVHLLEKEAQAKGIDTGKYQEQKGEIGNIIKCIEEKDYPAPSVSGKVSEGHAVISWNRIEAEGFLGYKVVASKENPSPKYPADGYIAYITDPDTMSLTVKSGIQPGESYYFSVTAVYERDIFVAGNAVKLTVPAEEPEPTPTPKPSEEPEEYQSSTIKGSVSGDKVRLSWEKITSDAFVGYKIVASATDSTPKYPQNGYIKYITDRDKTSLSVYDGYGSLKGGRSYYFSVTVVYKGDKFIAGNAVHIKVPEPEPEPEPEPSDDGEMKAASISGKIENGKVKLSWSKIAHEQFQGYKVVYSATDSHPSYPESDYLSYITNAGTTYASYSLGEFEAGKKYYFAITVLYEDGTRKTGNAISLTIPEEAPEEPEEPMVSTSISGSINEEGVIRLSWNKVEHPKFEGYKVVYSKSPNPVYPDDPYKYYITDPNDTSVSFNWDCGKFDAGETYYFSITVLYDGGKKAGNDVAITMPPAS